MPNIDDITFLYPYFFLLIPLYILCDIYCKKRVNAISFSNVTMLEAVYTKQYNWAKLLKYLILLCFIIALSTPIVQKHHQFKNSLGYDISLVVDASSSMREDDRFNITKKIVSNFIARRTNDNIALSFFADYSFVASPLTYDKGGLNTILDYSKIGIAGARSTALYEALYLGAGIFTKSESKNKIMILLTDGINTVKSIPLSIALKKIKKYNIKVYTIAVGKKGDYNKKLLQQIATNSNGKFFETNDPSKLSEIYNEINTLEKSKVKTTKYTQNIHYFKYPLYLSLFLLIIYIIIKRDKYIVLVILLILVALYRPTIQAFRSTIPNISKESISMIVAFDIGASMQSKDIYPSRFKFAQEKFYTLLSKLKNQKIGVVGFSNQAYFISAPTSDYHVLKYLVSHIDLTHINQKGSNLLSALKAINHIIKEKQKAIIIFTDGTNNIKFYKEIKYARNNNIKVYIYNIGTDIGGTIKIKNQLLKDNDGNIVVTTINENIEKLSNSTGGIYQKYSLSSNDLDKILNDINSKFKVSRTSKEKSSIANDTELFYIPLILAILGLSF